MKSLRSLIVGTVAAALIVGAGYAALYNFPFASLTATSRLAATLPMSGSECIPGDTNLSGGRQPQTACYTQGNLKGNYVTAITSTNATIIPWSVADNAGLYTLTLGANQTLAAPTGLTSGQVVNLLIIQAGAGSHTITWAAPFAWACRAAYETGCTTVAAPTLTTTTGRADLYTFVAGTKLFGSGASSQNRTP